MKIEIFDQSEIEKLHRNSLNILENVGINPDRYRLEWVSASEGKRFSEVVTEFVNTVKELGPMPKTGDKIKPKKEKAKEGA